MGVKTSKEAVSKDIIITVCGEYITQWTKEVGSRKSFATEKIGFAQRIRTLVGGSFSLTELANLITEIKDSPNFHELQKRGTRFPALIAMCDQLKEQMTREIAGRSMALTFGPGGGAAAAASAAPAASGEGSSGAAAPAAADVTPAAPAPALPAAPGGDAVAATVAVPAPAPTVTAASGEGSSGAAAAAAAASATPAPAPALPVASGGGSGGAAAAAAAARATVAGARKTPTPYEYFLMSDAAYDVPERIEAAIIKMENFDKDKSWKCAYTVTGSDSMRALIFVNEKTQQVVVSYRGTASEHTFSAVTTLITDLVSVVGARSSEHVKAALQIDVESCITDYLKTGYQLSFTGHSLGGYLAEKAVDIYGNKELRAALSAKDKRTRTEEERFNIENAYANASAVTFDSPGIRSDDRKTEGLLNVMAFKFWPNPVNVSGTPVNPRMIYALTPVIDVPMFESAVSKIGQIHGMLSYYSCFDPDGDGYPREGMWQKMEAWPQLSADAIKAIVDAYKFSDKSSIANVVGFFDLLAKGLKIIFLPGAKTTVAYAEMNTEIINARKALATKDLSSAEIVAYFAECNYIRGTYNSLELRRQIDVSGFPADLGKFLQSYYEFKSLLTDVAIRTDKLNQFYKAQDLADEDVSLLNMFSMADSRVVLSLDSGLDMHTFRDTLEALYERNRSEHPAGLLFDFESFKVLSIEERLKKLDTMIKAFGTMIAAGLDTDGKNAERKAALESEKALNEKVLEKLRANARLTNVTAATLTAVGMAASGTATAAITGGAARTGGAKAAALGEGATAAIKGTTVAGAATAEATATGADGGASSTLDSLTAGGDASAIAMGAGAAQNPAEMIRLAGMPGSILSVMKAGTAPAAGGAGTSEPAPGGSGSF